MEVENFKCVVIGDGAVGKTCMLLCFVENRFPPNYVPTIFDNHTVRLLVDDRPVNLELYDTAGQEEFDKLRPLGYADSDVFLLCYSVISNDSFENIKNKWHPELRDETGGCPFILVGTKMDLRKGGDSSSSEVSTKAGEQLAKSIKAHSFVECSALHQTNLKRVFDQACRCAFTARNDPDFPPQRSYSDEDLELQEAPEYPILPTNKCGCFLF